MSGLEFGTTGVGFNAASSVSGFNVLPLKSKQKLQFLAEVASDTRAYVLDLRKSGKIKEAKSEVSNFARYLETAYNEATPAERPFIVSLERQFFGSTATGLIIPELSGTMSYINPQKQLHIQLIWKSTDTLSDAPPSMPARDKESYNNSFGPIKYDPEMFDLFMDELRTRKDGVEETD